TIERGPAIGTGLKRQRFGLIEFAFVLQIEGKPRMKNLSAKVLTRRAAKIDVSQFISGETVPSAVVPGAGHQVIDMIGISLLQNLICLYWAIKVFLVPPAGDVHDGHRDLLELIHQRLLLPELVV